MHHRKKKNKHMINDKKYVQCKFTSAQKIYKAAQFYKSRRSINKHVTL